MRMRRLRYFKRAGLAEALAGANQRLQSPNEPLVDRAFVAGPIVDRLRAVSRTVAPQENGKRVQGGVQCEICDTISLNYDLDHTKRGEIVGYTTGRARVSSRLHSS
jgi:hypothetical protein